MTDFSYGDTERPIAGYTERPITERPIAGYTKLSAFLTSEGFPTSRSTLQKYCSPAINIGPPREGYFGRLPIFLPSRALRWARERIVPQRAWDVKR